MRVKGLSVHIADDKLEASSLCASEGASCFFSQRINWKLLHFVRVKGLLVLIAEDKLYWGGAFRY